MESSKETHFLFFLCIALIPLSIENKTTIKKINYLFYMDNLKLPAKNNDDDLDGLLSTIKRFSDEIGKQFDL